MGQAVSIKDSLAKLNAEPYDERIPICFLCRKRHIKEVICLRKLRLPPARKGWVW